MNFIQEVKWHIQSKLPVKVVIDQKVSEFCSKLEISERILSIRSRKEEIVIYWKLFCVWCDIRPTYLAKEFGYDHSTIIHHRKMHEANLLTDKEYKRLWNLLNTSDFRTIK